MLTEVGLEAAFSGLLLTVSLATPLTLLQCLKIVMALAAESTHLRFRELEKHDYGFEKHVDFSPIMLAT